MFKLKNMIVGSLLVLSASTLVGCSQLAEQIRGIEKKEVAPNPDTVEVNGKEIKLPDNSIVDGKAQTKGKALEKGFKVVGDERYGYFQIPENFVIFKDVSAKDPDMKQFSDATGTFILTFKPIEQGVEFEGAVAGLVEGMRKSGPSVVANMTEINGNKAAELFQYYQSDDYKLYAYVLNEGGALKYVSIEYRGDQEDLKNKILDLYSNVEPNAQVSESTAPISQKANGTSENSEFTIETKTNNFKVIQVEKSKVNVHALGVFDDNKQYYATIYNTADFKTIGSAEVKPSVNSDGSTFLNLTFNLEKDLITGEYSIDITESNSNSDFFQKLEFTTK